MTDCLILGLGLGFEVERLQRERDEARAEAEAHLGRLKHHADRRLEAEAAAAQMRAALEMAQQNVRALTGGDERRIAAALATDAGRELLERVARYEQALTVVAAHDLDTGCRHCINIARAALAEEGG